MADDSKNPSGWRWCERKRIDSSSAHLRLRYGSAADAEWDSWPIIALVAEPKNRVFNVQFMVDRTLTANAAMSRAVVDELDFYLVDKQEPNPYAYALYHCGTSANLYSSVHWSAHDPLNREQFWYTPDQFQSWLDAHAAWWPGREDPSVWGTFAPQAESGRYMFSSRDQPHLHFAETLVGQHLESKGYQCWTNVRLFRKPGQRLDGQYGAQTAIVERLLQESAGVVPQVEYEKVYVRGVHLKRIDLVGFHEGRSHWVFSEVKKDDDPVHFEQSEALRFLRTLFRDDCADVYLSSVRKTDPD